MDPSAPVTDPTTEPAGAFQPQTRAPAHSPAPSFDQRLVALIEVVLCSDFLTQILIAWTMAAFGFARIGPDGGFDLRFIAPLLLADTVLLVGLILLILRSHGERPGRIFFGDAHWWAELRAAPAMVGIAYAIAITVMLSVGMFAPWLHTVAENPMQNLLLAPRDATIFALVVILAGGVREEVQRAFILTRFEHFLGGPTVGVIVSSVAFGAGHLVQGVDATIATGLLGAYWGMAYLRRRSIIAPVVSHAAFDVLQIVIFLVSGR